MVALRLLGVVVSHRTPGRVVAGDTCVNADGVAVFIDTCVLGLVLVRAQRQRARTLRCSSGPAGRGR